MCSFFTRGSRVRQGGACYFARISYLNLDQSTFTNNTAGRIGGALYINTLSHGVISSCIFDSNTAHFGGAVYNTKTNLPDLEMGNCTFSRNRAEASGGALFLNTTSTHISHCEFSNNSSPFGGAILMEAMLSTLHITGTKFSRNNYVTHFQDSLFASAVYVSQAQEMRASNSTFEDNHAGGAIILGDTSAVIDNCSFRGNSGVFGGAISVPIYATKLSVLNTSFLRNTAPSGGAMRLDNKNTVIQSCYFLENKGTTFPHIVDIGVSNMIHLRSFNNTFVELQSHPAFVTLFALNDQLEGAVFYFWKTMYQSRRHKTLTIDSNFVHNTTMPMAIAASDRTNLTEEFSQFASGKCLSTIGNVLDIITIPFFPSEHFLSDLRQI